MQRSLLSLPLSPPIRRLLNLNHTLTPTLPTTLEHISTPLTTTTTIRNEKMKDVLVYSGEGATPSAIQQAVNALKKLLGNRHDIKTVSSQTILSQPWMV